ncbi:acyl-CoA N-acyltransferase [Trametes meyenii]|nr:acyl-CoA N-acyltransferase [Trametes meyenii]
MAIHVEEITHPSEAALDAYAKLLAEAFHYSYFGGGLGNDKDLQEPFLRVHLTAALAAGEGEIHVATLDDVGPVGVALWFGPGQKFLDSEAQRKAGWDQFMAKLAPQYRDWWARFLKQYDILVEQSLGPGVKLGGYHLQLIGVSPDHQRKGVATALMKYAETKAHAVHVPSVLETVGATNVEIYKSLGYEIGGSGPIDAPPPSTGSFEMFVFIKNTEHAR